MLTTFVSQAVAFEFYSQVINQNHQQQSYQADTSMQHEHHNMMQMNSDNQHSSAMNMDCCKNGDNCFMSTCHAYMAPPSFAFASNERIAEQVIASNNFYISFTAPSLYRPPIAA